MLFKYNEETDRYNDLHCGDCFRIKVNGKWKDVRIEKGNNWYVIDEDKFTCSCKALEGLEVEI